VATINCTAVGLIFPEGKIKRHAGANVSVNMTSIFFSDYFHVDHLAYFSYAAVTKVERNTADGRFSTAC
jgi:hypothetical protein